MSEQEYCYDCSGKVQMRWLEEKNTYEFYCTSCGKIQRWDNQPTFEDKDELRG